MLRAVFFDIDDTLFSTTTFAARAREQSVDAMIAMGVRCDRELMIRELREVVQEFSSNFEHHYDKLLSRLEQPSLIAVSAASRSGTAGNCDSL
jgi:putative hydrolase of the HAD superfamily